MRYIVTIKRKEMPMVDYLSRNGFRCYTAKNAAVFRTAKQAQEERDYFASLMRDFELTVEAIPSRMSLAKAVLYAAPVI